MIYVMCREMYKEYTVSKPGYKGLKHDELIEYINSHFNLREEVKQLQVK